MPNAILTSAIDALASRRDLSADETAEVLAEIMHGEVSETQIAGFLIALRTKGETVEELAGLARTMRELAAHVPTDRDDLLDTAGTGGGRSTFNVSTTAALIAAGDLRRPRSMRAPSASSTSAEPERLVAERLPCLATAHPAPAAISAAVVETLNVLRPPPVPAVSSRSSRVGRHVRGELAHRAGQPGELVDRLPLRAQRDQEAGDLDLRDVAVHDLGEHLGGLVGACRSRREASVSIALVSTGLGTSSRSRKLREQLAALFGEHRLGVELDALGRQLAVAQRHQHAAAARALLAGSPAARRRRPASGSGPPSSWSRSPAKIVGPSCSIVVALPWTGWCSSTLPPNACASAWWPRHTPSVGTPASGKRRTTSSEMPA